jgi:glutamyl-tRNA reductase
MASQIWAAEIFLHNLPDDLRQRLFEVDPNGRYVFGNKRRGFDEVFILSTDSQFVVYGVGDTIDPMLNFFLQDPLLFEHVHFYKTSEASVNHLFATATGLCSDIKGSQKAAAHIRQAHYSGMQCGGVGLILDNLVRQSLRISKKIRETTQLDKLGEILVDAGMEIVFNERDNPADLMYLVIGDNDIARSALEFFYHEGFRNVIVCGHDNKRSFQLAEYYALRSIEYTQLETFLGLADVIISENPVSQILFDQHGHFEERERIVLDFGNAFQEKNDFKKNPLVKVFTIDDINSFPATTANIFHLLEEAWKMVEDETSLALSSLESLACVPILSSCWSDLISRGEQEISLLLDQVTFATVEKELISFYNKRLMRQRPANENLFRSDINSKNPANALVRTSLSKSLIHSYSAHLN